MRPRQALRLSTLGIFLLLWLLLRGKVLFHGDALVYNLPQRSHAAAILREGEIPLWVEELFAGFPLHAEGQAGVFYPPNLLYLFLPASEAFALLIALHSAVGFLGMALLLRRLGVAGAPSLVASALFVFSGPVTSRWHHTNLHESLMWAPYVLLACTEHRGKSTPVVAAMGFALIWLASHAQVAFVVLLTALLWWLPRRYSMRRLALVAASGLILAAVQVLPLLELLPLTGRVNLTFPDAAYYSLTPLQLFSGLVAGYRGGVLFISYPVGELNTYVGPAVVVLAAAGWVAWRGRRLGWALPILVGSLLALGDHFPPYRLLFERAPFFGLVRAPARFFWVVLFTLTVLCAQGLSSGWRARAPLRVMLIWVSLLSLGELVLLALAYNPMVAAQRFEQAVAVARNRLSQIGDERLFLVTADATRRMLADLSSLHRQPLSYIAWLWPNTHLFSGYASAAGYTPLRLSAWQKLFEPMPSRPALDVLSVRWLIAANLAGTTFRHHRALPGDMHLYENLTALPRARLVGRARVLTGAKLHQALSRGAFSREEVLLAKPLCPPISSMMPAGSVTWETNERQIKRFRVVTAAPAYFVLADALYPGWRAYVNGRPAPLGAGYGFVRTLCLAAGAQAVEMRFFPLSFFLGYLLSCLALIGVLLWCSTRAVALGGQT